MSEDKKLKEIEKEIQKNAKECYKKLKEIWGEDFFDE